MSCLHNEAILETIYEDVLEELEQTASTITQQRFEDLQWLNLKINS